MRCTLRFHQKKEKQAITKDKGAVFLMQIGHELSHGEPHDGRAPDYDDWSLNGDIIFWNPVLESAFELSSMGIRVDEEVLLEQLEKAGCTDRLEFPFHQMVASKELPYHSRWWYWSIENLHVLSFKKLI